MEDAASTCSRFAQIESIFLIFLNLTEVNFSNKLNMLIHVSTAMSTEPVKRKPRSVKRSVSPKDVVRALVVSAALGGLLLLAIFVTSGTYFSAERKANNAATKIAPLPKSAGGEAAHRVASIVVETDNKGRCEERRFDNRTGKIVSSNYVDCDARLAPERDTTPSEATSAERMRAILGAFKR